METIERKAEVATAERPVTRAEVAELIAEAISSLRIYVVESDITQAQQAVRAIIEKAEF